MRWVTSSGLKMLGLQGAMEAELALIEVRCRAAINLPRNTRRSTGC